MNEYYKSIEDYNEPLNEIDANTLYGLVTIGMCGVGYLAVSAIQKAIYWFEKHKDKQLWKEIQKKEKVLGPAIEKLKDDKGLKSLLDQLEWVYDEELRNRQLEKIGDYVRKTLSKEELATIKGLKPKE